MDQYYSYRAPIGDDLGVSTDNPVARDFGHADLEVPYRWREAWIGSLAENPADHRRHVRCQARLALSRIGWISSLWGESENNRRAKYYRLTKAGKKQLEAETKRWDRISWAIAQALEAS